MTKNKLQKFAEMAQFPNVFQPEFNEDIKKYYYLKGKWDAEVFKNNNPIVLEIGCGKGEYSVGLGKNYKNKNFIGIDIKGSRMWLGAKTAVEQNFTNIVFLRTKIDLITRFFDTNEVSEIWIPFPDPQPKKVNKRLTSSFFLSLYQKFVVNNAIIHLKTDSILLHQYTVDLLKTNNIEPIKVLTDVYASGIDSELTTIQTYYEKMFLKENKKITYVSFRLNKDMTIKPAFEKNIEDYKY
jgi:tRNA (guanine-N7-)-methyltransferase